MGFPSSCFDNNNGINVKKYIDYVINKFRQTIMNYPFDDIVKAKEDASKLINYICTSDIYSDTVKTDSLKSIYGSLLILEKLKEIIIDLNDKTDQIASLFILTCNLFETELVSDTECIYSDIKHGDFIYFAENSWALIIKKYNVYRYVMTVKCEDSWQAFIKPLENILFDSRIVCDDFYHYMKVVKKFDDELDVINSNQGSPVILGGTGSHLAFILIMKSLKMPRINNLLTILKAVIETTCNDNPAVPVGYSNAALDFITKYCMDNE